MIEYKITYYLDDGVKSSVNPSQYPSEDSYVLEAPSKEGEECLKILAELKSADFFRLNMTIS